LQPAQRASIGGVQRDVIVTIFIVRCARGAVLLGEITAVLAQPNVCLRNREGGLGSLAVCIVNKRAEFDSRCCALFVSTCWCTLY